RLDRAISALLTRAFRRDRTDDEMLRYGALARSAPGFAEGDDDARVREGLRTVIAAALQSPHFLYRVERGRRDEATRSGDVLRVPLTERELATRWSYALFDAPPDSTLDAELASGALATDEGRRAVVARMLADPRADETILRFHRRLYGVADYTSMRRDQAVFPGTESLGADAERESTALLRHVVAEEGGVRELLLDRTGFVNRRLAELYALPTEGRADDVFERVELPDTRPGILTRVGWTAWQADQLERRTILRGVFVIRNILCEPLGPPASGNFASAAMRGAPEGPATNRDLVAFRTEWADCASCHATRINPIGFAFEGYDALGRFVTTDRGLPIDASGSLAIGGEVIEYASASDLLAQIAERPAAHDCYASSAMEYLLGARPLGLDASVAGAIGDASLEEGLSVRRIFAEILSSDSFRTLRVPAPGVAR
nr:DUF1592 domain-containing protein [Myxococcota bacterium]